MSTTELEYLGGGVARADLLGGPGVNSHLFLAGFEGNQLPSSRPGIGPDPNPPAPLREFKPEAIDKEVIKQLTSPRFEPGPLSKYLGEKQSSKTHEGKWPAWACWQSAVGLFALCFVIGFLVGRFGPSD